MSDNFEMVFGWHFGENGGGGVQSSKQCA